MRVFEENQQRKFKYYVPAAARFNLTKLFHDDQCHIGVDKTIESMRTKYWFPGTTSFIKKYIGHCIVCLSAKRPSGPKQGLLHPIEKLLIPFHTVHADCTGPFGTANYKYRYLLLLVDAYTKFIILVPIENLTGPELVRALEPQLSLFGTTKVLLQIKEQTFQVE